MLLGCPRGFLCLRVLFLSLLLRQQRQCAGLCVVRGCGRRGVAVLLLPPFSHFALLLQEAILERALVFVSAWGGGVVSSHALRFETNVVIWAVVTLWLLYLEFLTPWPAAKEFLPAALVETARAISAKPCDDSEARTRGIQRFFWGTRGDTVLSLC